MKTLFITGTDTGVGKTYVGRILVKALIKAGLSCVPRKPIETGCSLTNGEYYPEDADQYYHATNKTIPLDEICPFRYEPPISPERAIRLANQIVTIENLAEICSPNTRPDYLLIEGAGGFYSPLCSDGLNADLALKLTSDVILIVKDRLGCINQALLTIEAIENKQLNLIAVVLNQYREHKESEMNNFDDLQRRLKYPVIAIPNMIDASSEELDMQYASIDKILDTIREC